MSFPIELKELFIEGWIWLLKGKSVNHCLSNFLKSLISGGRNFNYVSR